MENTSTGILLLLSMAMVMMPLGAQSESQNSRFDALDNRIDDLRDFIKEGFSTINKRIDDLKSELKDDNEKGFSAVNKRIDDVNNRIDDLKWLIGWILGFLGTAFAGVIVAIMTQYFTRRQEEKKRRNVYQKQLRDNKLSEQEGCVPYQDVPSAEKMPPETLVKEG